MRTLTINGTACGNDVTLLSLDYGYATIVNYQDWLKHSTDPLYYGQDTQYTVASIELLVEAKDIGALEKRCSDVYASLRKAVIKDSMVNFALDGTATGIQEQRLGPKARTLTITFQGIKKGLPQNKSIVLGLNEQTFVAEGNDLVSTKMTIIPEKNYTILTIVINDRKYVLKNVIHDANTNNNKIVIDGATGIVTRGGNAYIDHYDSWEMPKLNGGNNKMKCLEGYPTVIFEYCGRWI